MEGRRGSEIVHFKTLICGGILSNGGKKDMIFHVKAE